MKAKLNELNAEFDGLTAKTEDAEKFRLSIEGLETFIILPTPKYS
jgi:hypothetical protein